MVLFTGRVFLKCAWRVCFAQCLLLLLPDYLHGLPGASPPLRMVAQLNHWQVDSFASFSWPSFDHSVLLTAMAWENRECTCRALLADAFLTHAEKEQMGNGAASLGEKALSWRYRSIWRGFPLESQIAQEQLYVHAISLPKVFTCHLSH